MTISQSDFEQLLNQEKKRRARAEEGAKFHKQQVHAYETLNYELQTTQRALLATIVHLQQELERVKTYTPFNEKNVRVIGGLQGGLRGFGEDCSAAIDELNPRETYDTAQETMPRPPL